MLIREPINDLKAHSVPLLPLLIGKNGFSHTRAFTLMAEKRLPSHSRYSRFGFPVTEAIRKTAGVSAMAASDIWRDTGHLVSLSKQSQLYYTERYYAILFESLQIFAGET
jgi:hypothetical protein